VGPRRHQHGDPTDLHGGHAQCWSWDYDPNDGWVYVVATGFQRDKGIILMRVRPEHIGQRSRYASWSFANGRWAWGEQATPGSRFDIQGGIGLMVSQWNTDVGWPYRAMQFKAALRDTTKTVHPTDPINL
jgi:hypothetical protein